MGDGVRQKTIAVGLADAGAGHRGDLRRPKGRDRVGRQLDDVQGRGFGLTEGGGEELLLACGDGSVLRCSGLVRIGHVDADVGGAGGPDDGEELARDECAGEAGLCPGEVELSLFTGGLFAGVATGDGGLIAGHGCVQLHGEAIGEETDQGEPSPGIQEDGDGVGQRRGLDAVYRTCVAALQHTAISEGKCGRGSLCHDCRQRDNDCAVSCIAFVVERFAPADARAAGEPGYTQAVV